MDDKDFRAKQFMPFDALKGFYELIDTENITITNKKLFSDDMFDTLNNSLKEIKKGDYVIIKYYFNTDYIETTGIIKKIDEVYKKIYILSSVINFEDILSIKKIKRST